MGVMHTGQSGFRQEIAQLQRDIRRLGKMTFNNVSLGGAGMRVYDAGVIRFEEGGGVVIEGDGTLTGSGDFSWTGPWEFSGDGDITGDVTVSGGGRIIAGNVEIIPSTAGGIIKIGDSTISVVPGGGAISITHPSGAQLVLNNGGAHLVNGGVSMHVETAGISFSGVPTAALAGMPAGGLWVNGSGYLRVAS